MVTPSLVHGHDFELALKRLRGKQPIERISVMEGQIGDADNMPERLRSVTACRRRLAYYV